ncbi:hypothetical protein [Clostridium sp. C8]|uniref:hypothetical protein n=1 Tax=Clostridium sp. C8 TaxID=1667357 RepID=UPI00062E85A1|nr:hypothetical protein [Clostridium sp. C8]KLE17317.1 hypothetical protein AAT22_01695 [Clostridium sp. C8]
MNEKLYNRLNNIFITISFILIILVMIYSKLYNIVPQIILLLISISTLINGKFKFKRYSRISFKKQFALGILSTILSLILILGATLSIFSIL